MKFYVASSSHSQKFFLFALKLLMEHFVNFKTSLILKIQVIK